MRNIDLHYSPDEAIWYYQKRDHSGKVSVKEYQTEGEALKDYHNLDNPTYKWE